MRKLILGSLSFGASFLLFGACMGYIWNKEWFLSILYFWAFNSSYGMTIEYIKEACDSKF